MGLRSVESLPPQATKAATCDGAPGPRSARALQTKEELQGLGFRGLGA